MSGRVPPEAIRRPDFFGEEVIRDRPKTKVPCLVLIINDEKPNEKF